MPIKNLKLLNESEKPRKRKNTDGFGGEFALDPKMKTRETPKKSGRRSDRLKKEIADGMSSSSIAENTINLTLENPEYTVASPTAMPAENSTESTPIRSNNEHQASQILFDSGMPTGPPQINVSSTPLQYQQMTPVSTFAVPPTSFQGFPMINPYFQPTPYFYAHQQISHTNGESKVQEPSLGSNGSKNVDNRREEEVQVEREEQLEREEEPLDVDSSIYGDEIEDLPFVSQEDLFYDRLQKCVTNGILDIFESGKIIFDGYTSQYSFLETAIDRFVKNHQSSVLGAKSPPAHVFGDKNFSLISQHGSLLYVNFVRINQSPITVMENSDEKEMAYLSLVGSITNIKSSFKYPSVLPFSGQPVSLIELPQLNYSNPHVFLKRLIFVIVSRSCSNPVDVQDVTWVAPGDSRSGRQKFLPSCFYSDLKQLCMEVFEIDEMELERRSWRPAYKSLKCLEGCDTIDGFKKKYRRLSFARSVFSESGFHRAFREAMTELRSATYSEPQERRIFGEWQYRKRGKRRCNEESQQISQAQPE